MSKPITAAEVKALREASGATMQQCKQALRAAGGDFEAALRRLRAPPDEAEPVPEHA